jgi:hypothetical protein
MLLLISLRLTMRKNQRRLTRARFFEVPLSIDVFYCLGIKLSRSYKRIQMTNDHFG